MACRPARTEKTGADAARQRTDDLAKGTSNCAEILEAMMIAKSEV